MRTSAPTSCSSSTRQDGPGHGPHNPLTRRLIGITCAGHARAMKQYLTPITLAAALVVPRSARRAARGRPRPPRPRAATEAQMRAKSAARGPRVKPARRVQSRAPRRRTSSVSTRASVRSWPSRSSTRPSPTTRFRPRRATESSARWVVPVDRPGREHVRAQRPAEHLAHRARRPSSRRSRSMPVSMPISCSIETRSSVAMLPVAPGGHRAAAELAEARLERRRQPGLERGEHVGQALAARVVEVGGELDVVAERLAARGEELAHLARVGHAGRVAEADLLRAGVAQPPRRSRRRARAGTSPS